MRTPERVSDGRASKARRRLLVAGGLLLAAGLGIALLQRSDEKPSIPSPATVLETYPGLDLEDPQPSFALLRHVTDTGGDEVTRELAIAWLDGQARRRLPLAPGHESWLLGMLEDGGHPEWNSGFRFWIFNSAFNNLQYATDQEAFTKILRELALHSPDRTMRLYALQHLELQRTGGRLIGELAAGVEADLKNLVAAPDGEVAGLAVRLLTEWNGQTAAPDAVAQALGLATDHQRAIDVRVTALHAAGSSSLPLARRLAADATQPIPVRKAAIACIGRHGIEADCSELEALAGESTRLAQAADPALRAIRQRVSHPDAPDLIAF